MKAVKLNGVQKWYIKLLINKFKKVKREKSLVDNRLNKSRIYSKKGVKKHTWNNLNDTKEDSDENYENLLKLKHKDTCKFCLEQENDLNKTTLPELCLNHQNEDLDKVDININLDSCNSNSLISPMKRASRLSKGDSSIKMLHLKLSQNKHKDSFSS